MDAIPHADAFADAVADVESGGEPEHLRDTCVGDGGAALGRYQIHEIFVRECNRILGRAVYIPADRTDPVKARDMTILHATHYWQRLRGLERTYRNLYRIHNGGPSGHRKPATEANARKFDRAMASRIATAKGRA